MSEKSIQKKQYIVEKARKVFCERGFKDVTMKDIVESCEISRGGLYLYFKDTREVFEAVLAAEQEDAMEVLKNKNQESPADVLLSFLELKKEEILKKKDNLSVAVFEYQFAQRAAKKEASIKKQYQDQVKALENLIQDGIRKKWMVCDNAQAAARNIVYAMEGLRVNACICGVQADVVDQEINCLMGSVGLVVK